MPTTSVDEKPVDTLVAWVEECWPAMVAVARKQGWDENDAKDIAQEAVLTALGIARREPERLDAVRSPCSWLCGIAWNMGRVAFTKRQRRERILRENPRGIREELYPESDPNGEGETLPEGSSHVFQTVLPPRQREIIRLVLTHDMTDAEVAMRLEISDVTVRWHRNEAIRALKQVLRGKNERGGGGGLATAGEVEPNRIGASPSLQGEQEARKEPTRTQQRRTP